MEKMAYRLGLDVGTNSLGWSVLKRGHNGDPCGVEAAGSRIFSDGRDVQSKATLAADRREARSARRRRDRYRQRRASLLATLAKAGLFPEKGDKARQALQELNPLELRARLLTETAEDILDDIKERPNESGKARHAVTDVKPEHLIGRALFHLNQRRGFKSNRKDRGTASEGVISTTISKTRQDMKEKGKRTIGDWLWSLNEKGKPSRARPRKKSGEIEQDSGKVDHYDFYVDRDMLKDEFNEIWEKQAGQYSTLMTKKQKERIGDEIIFMQRPLKALDVGMCTYMKGEKRGAKALSSIQQHRIYQDLNNLTWGDKKLRDCKEAYCAIENMLLQPTNQKGEVTFDAMRKELKNLGVMQEPEGLSTKEKQTRPIFNLEKGKGGVDNRKHLNGDKTSAFFGNKESPVAENWKVWGHDKQDAFVETIIGRIPDEKREGQERYRTDEEAIAALEEQYGLSKDDATICVKKSNLETGYADLSAKAAKRLIARMKGDGKPTQREAVQQEARESEDDSFKDPYDVVGRGEYEELRYYGEAFQGTSYITPGKRKDEEKWNDLKYWGGVSNPSVHIALNQIRQVVNEIIKKHGKPDSIAIELGRNLPTGPKKRKGVVEKQKKQREENKRDKKELQKTFNILDPSRDDIQKLRLWKEAQKTCPYCGKNFGCAEVFTSKIQIEHIIPQALGGQDNWGNLTIAHAACNQEKGDRMPYEAFGDKIKYSKLPNYKHWRFGKDAQTIWEKIYKGFLSRHLNDTRYIGVIAKAYLGDICPDKKITVVTGQLTHSLRKYWNLDSVLDDPNRPEEERGTKNRNDHRHHAIDAIVVGMVTRSMVQQVSHIKDRNQILPMEMLMERLVGNSKEERENFPKMVKSVVENIIVSHKVRRKKPRYETYVKDENGNIRKNEKGRLIRISTEKRDEAILDKKGRPKKITTDSQLHNATAYGGPAFKKNKPEKVDFRQPIKVEHKGKTKPRKYTVIPIEDKKSGKIYKGYEPDGNWGMEIYQYPDKYPDNPKEGADWKHKCGIWEGVCITRFEANQPEFDPDRSNYRLGADSTQDRRPCPGAKFIMRLQINDLIDIGTKDKPEIMRVKKTSGQTLSLVPHNEANAAVRGDNKNGTGSYNGHEFSGKLQGKQNAKVIAVQPSTSVTGTYQGQKFAGKVQKAEGEKKKQVVFKLGGDDQKLDCDTPGLDWQYDDETFRTLANTSNAWQYVEDKDEFQIDAKTDGLEWRPDDDFSVTERSAGKLQKLKARKVHISPTGLVNYEKRRKPRRKH